MNRPPAPRFGPRNRSLSTAILLILCALTGLTQAAGASDWQREKLGRGLVAVKTEEGIFLSWRLLPDDPQDVAFNLYRQVDGGDPVPVHESPLHGGTNHVDRHPAPGEVENLRYHVRTTEEVAEHGLDSLPTAGSSSSTAALWEKGYLEIPIRPIEGYRPGDASVADLDGDGVLEIVLHQTSRGRDNSHPGVTGTPVLDAYELDGTHLWRIDLGINIREGEHYTQFMVYDLDGDGRAELTCKTADGTKDGKGAVLGDGEKDWRTLEEGSRLHGRILSGPEYLTVFDGLTGAALHTVDYVPGRDPIDGWGGRGGNGGNDSYGNRCDRFLACVAYLDGKRPSVVMCRGVYGRTVLAAWDFRDGRLSQRWVFDSGISYPPYEDASPYSGMGGHSLAVADVDADGKDEIVYQAMVVDDDGTGLYATGRRHGDAMHVGDFNPARPGLELFLITENEDRTVAFQTPGAGMHDARTGEALWTHSPGEDVRQGLAADIDPRHFGAEAWGGPGGLRTAAGEPIGPAPGSTGFAVWWDGDFLRELLGRGPSVTKWNWETGREEILADLRDRGSDGNLNERRNRFRGARPCLTGDLLGDWREELLLPSPDGNSLRLHTTTIPTAHRLTTLLGDRQYRLALAWQNVVYNKPPHPSFYLGHGMDSR